MQEYSDSELVESYRTGTEEAFDILTERYTANLYRFVFRLIGNTAAAEELTQDIFIKAWKNLHRFDTNKSFQTWLYTIARNTAIDWLRKKKSIPFSQFEKDESESEHGSGGFAETIKDMAPLQHELFEKEENIKLVKDALHTLSPDDQTIIMLHEGEDLTFEAIGTIVGKPLNTVKSRYRRALLKLRESLAPKVGGMS